MMPIPVGHTCRVDYTSSAGAIAHEESPKTAANAARIQIELFAAQPVAHGDNPIVVRLPIGFDPGLNREGGVRALLREIDAVDISHIAIRGREVAEGSGPIRI